MRGLVFILTLFSSLAGADEGVVEVCKGGNALIKTINEGRQDEYLINARHYLQDGNYPLQAARREALAELLRDARVVLNVAGSSPSFNVLDAVDHEGAVLQKGLGGTFHDCINVITGDRAWRRLLQAGVVDQ